MNDNGAAGKTVLVTGSNGQLGQELQKIAADYPSYQFLFTTRQNLPVEDFDAVQKYFYDRQIDHCINCAAFTHVDKAETEPEKAFILNADAVGNLAKICREHGTQLTHISSDYVFDGTSQVPYKEEDRIAPVNVYGQSKLRGEELALNYFPGTVILRTSWVYSSFGNNFVKTMVRLMKEKKQLQVVNDQYGSPTYAADLAKVILELVKVPEDISGIFNFCNTGITTWYDFAVAIKDLTKSDCLIKPVSTAQYPVIAKRPAYSVLDTTKIQAFLNITISSWQESLQNCLTLLS